MGRQIDNVALRSGFRIVCTQVDGLKAAYTLSPMPFFGSRTARTCGPRSSRMQPHLQGLSCFLWKVHSYNSQAADSLTSAMGVVESRKMTIEIISLPVICIKRSGVDLARQHRSRVDDSRNVMELRRARLNCVFERLNRLLEEGRLRKPALPSVR